MSEPKTDTATLISALRVLSREIYSEDGVANACILEGAERIAELQARAKELEKELLLEAAARKVMADYAARLSDELNLLLCAEEPEPEEADRHPEPGHHTEPDTLEEARGER